MRQTAQSARSSSEHSSNDQSMLLLLKEMQGKRTEASASRQDAAKQLQEMRVEKHAQPLTESSGSWSVRIEWASQEIANMRVHLRVQATYADRLKMGGA